MNEKIGFIGIIRKKPMPILGWTIGLTFVIGKVIEFIINALLDMSYSGYGPRTIIPITIFNPIIFVIVGINVVNHFKKKYNKALQTGLDNSDMVKRKERPDYYGNYTWKDIFSDREVFSFYVILAFVLWCVFYYIVQFISRLSSNYAISSLESTDMGSLFVLAAILAALLVVWLQNTVISWLSKTRKGNQVLSIVVFVLGIMTFIAMLGLSYLWEDAATLEESIAMDFLLGELIPIDLTTTAWALVTGWFWNKARKCTYVNFQLINKGALMAVVAFIISLTPLTTVIQMLWIMLREAFVML